MHVIVAEPSDNAVTSPLLSMEATVGAEDSHLTDLLVALVGEIVAFNVSVSPVCILTLVLFNDIPVTATTSDTADTTT